MKSEIALFHGHENGFMGFSTHFHRIFMKKEFHSVAFIITLMGCREAMSRNVLLIFLFYSIFNTKFPIF